ncbi:MAG: LptF/LptG family permease [Acidobacteriota bacterium]
MVRLIDRYLARGILTPFLMALLVFTFVLLVPFFVDLAEKLISKGVPTGMVIRVMATLLPQALAISIPMSLLIALLIGLGRFSSDREWVALQACGVSIFRVLRPVLVLAAAGWALTSYVIIWAVPDANQTFRELRYGIAAQRAEGEVRPRVFFEDFPNKVLYVRDLPDDGSPGWRDVFLADTSGPQNPTVYLAERGWMVLDREKRTVDLVLKAGTQHTSRAEAPGDYSVSRFDHLVLGLDYEAMFPRTGPQKGAREMTIAELRAEIAEIEQRGGSPHAEVMEIHKKFAIPVANLVFALLALALGLTTRRDGKLASFVVGIGVIFAYYVLMWTSEAAAKGHLVPAWLAMWVPTILLGGAGVAVLAVRGPASRWWVSWSSRARARLAPLLHTRVAVEVPAWLRRLASSLRSTGAGRPSAFGGVRLSILDGYLGRSFLRVFALTFVGVMGIFYISTFIDLSDKVFKGQATLGMVAEYLVYATPQFAYYVAPLSVLIAVLVTVGVLTRNSELIVMRACGISLYRTSVPLVLLGVAASAALFFFGENVLAYTNRRAEALNHVIRGGSPQTFDVLNRKWVVGHEGEIYNYLYFDPRRAELNGFSLFRFAPKAWRLQSRMFFHQVAFLQGPPAAGEHVPWEGRQGWVREFDRQIEAKSFRTFERTTIDLEPPQYFATELPDADRMNYRQLRRYIAELRASGFNVIEHEVALHRKVSFPWVACIMTLIGVPFAVSTGRRGALYGIGVGLVLAIVYWVATSVFAAVGAGGLIVPMLAAWAPNILFGALAAYLLLTVRT